MNLFDFSFDNPLTFAQATFWIFLAVVLLFYSPIKNKFRARHFYLFAVSMFFYYLSSGKFVILLLITTILTYLSGKAVFRFKKKSPRKFFLSLGVVISLAFLAYFKYAYFIVDIINTYFATNIKVVDYLALLANNSFGTEFPLIKSTLSVWQ